MEIDNKVARTYKGNKAGATGTYIILFLSLGAMTFFGVCNPTDRAQNGGIGGVAASVSGQDVSSIEFQREYSSYSERLRNQYGEDYHPQALKVAHTVMDRLIRNRILFLESAKLGLAASDEEIIRYLNSVAAFRDEKGAYSEEIFQGFLRNNRYSESTFLEEMRRNMTAQKLQQFIMTTSFVSTKEAELDYRMEETKFNVEYLKIDPSKMVVSVTPEEISAFLEKEGSKDKVKTFFDSHQSDYNSSERVKASHILISYKEARSAPEAGLKRTKEEAAAKAAQVLERLKKGEDFTAVAKQETDEPNGKLKGGDLGFFTFDAMVKEFSEVAFKLSVNELSSVVESPFGFHIIKIFEKKPATQISLEQATPGIVSEMLKKEKTPVIAKETSEALLAAIQKGEDVSAKLAVLQTSWAETGLFASNARYIPGLGSSQAVVEAALNLTNEHKLHDKVLHAGNSYIILRLKERKDVDLKTFDDSKKAQYSLVASNSQGYSMFQAFEAKIMEDYENSKTIYRNTSYLALDNEDAAATE